MTEYEKQNCDIRIKETCQKDNQGSCRNGRIAKNIEFNFVNKITC